jgi:ankyrin repeat protein
MRPALTPLHEFLQSHGSDSGEDLSKASSVRTLQRAVAGGRADVVSWFLSKGADVHKKDSSGATLLHTAVDHGHIGIAGLLLDHGADVNAADSKGLAPMHLVPADRSDLLALLVASGSQVDIKDCNGNSALMLAVLQGQAERVKTYLHNGADVDAAESISTSIVVNDAVLPPILVAIHEKHNSALKVLVEHGADLRPRFTKRGRTLLHFAVKTHNHEAVRCLLLAKVDIEARNKEGETALHEVAMKGDVAHSDTLLQLLLKAGAKIEAKDRIGFTALHEAARAGALKVVQGLLSAGADVATRSNRLRTPLHQAAENGHLEVVQRLLDAGAAIHAKDHKEETALHIACHTRCDKNLGVIKHLLGSGASVSEPAGLDRMGGRLPPHQAALSGFKEAVELFLDIGFNKGSTDAKGFQMIHYAASHGHVDVLKFLLERGTATSFGTRIEGDRPLHLAARAGHEEAVSVLCKSGANVNIGAWKDGCYPIHYAARSGHVKVISVLHKNGAKVDALDDQNKTALFHAVHKGQTRAVSLLCDYGASVNRRGRNVLVEAAYLGHVDIVSVLCKRNANVQIDTHTRDAPLIEAVRKGHREVVRILLEHGADIEVKTKTRDWTPLHLAANRGHKKIVNLLLEKGANRKMLTKDGKTAWALAQKNGHREVCGILGKTQIQAKSGTGDKASGSRDRTKAVASGKKASKK